MDRCPFAESVLRFMHLGPGALRDLLPAITSDVPAQQGNLKPPWAAVALYRMRGERDTNTARRIATD